MQMLCDGCNRCWLLDCWYCKIIRWGNSDQPALSYYPRNVLMMMITITMMMNSWIMECEVFIFPDWSPPDNPARQCRPKAGYDLVIMVMMMMMMMMTTMVMMIMMMMRQLQWHARWLSGAPSLCLCQLTGHTRPQATAQYKVSTSAKYKVKTL